MSKISNVKNVKNCQENGKILTVLYNPKTSKTKYKKCKKNALMDFENGEIVKIYKS